MIPKKIHYCWFGGNELPEFALKCIESWKKFCPDYEIIEWNETNYDINKFPYMQEAAARKRWAFVSDYARLDIIYNHGGIYLDTDVELIKSIDSLCEHDAFVGYGSLKTLNTGLGFGAVPFHPMIREMLDEYDGKHFAKEDGTVDDKPCTIYNTAPYIKYGLSQNNTYQIINDVAVLPMEYLSAKDLRTGVITITDNTYSIHHYSCSGHVKYGKQIIESVQKIRVRFGDDKKSVISKMLIWFIRKYYGLKWYLDNGGIKSVIIATIKKIFE